MAYKYRVLLKRKEHEEVVTPKKPFSFAVPVNEGEKIILPAHHKNLKDMPEWTRNQSVWVVSHIIHISHRSSDDFLILTSAKSILEELEFGNIWSELDIIIH